MAKLPCAFAMPQRYYYGSVSQPTKCQDSWRVSDSSGDMAEIEFDLIPPPLPVRLELNNLDIGVVYEGERIYGVAAKESR